MEGDGGVHRGRHVVDGPLRAHELHAVVNHLARVAPHDVHADDLACGSYGERGLSPKYAGNRRRRGTTPQALRLSIPGVARTKTTRGPRRRFDRRRA